MYIALHFWKGVPHMGFIIYEGTFVWKPLH